VEPMPIALPVFVAGSQDVAQIGADITQVIAQNLANSGLFRPLPPQSYIEQISNFSQEPRFGDWRTIQAQALVTGQAVMQPDGRLRAEFRLWDVFAQQQITGLQFVATPKSWRRIAHKISDAIYIALSGEGGYFDVSSAGAGAQIKAAMGNIFSQIQGVNSVFASVSLPVSVNTEGTYLNQIYIGMFRPDSAGLPRWSGNLKQYKLGISGGRLETQDADSARAVNNSTGFIAECARSFWTPTTTDTYWSFLPDGYWRTRLIATCLAVAGSEDSNYPDGNIVEKGAQAYTLRVPTTARTLHTTPTCSSTKTCASMVPFNGTNVTQTELGAANPAEHGQLINWALGLDIDDEQNTTPPVTAERRPSIHGDVVHSRPVAVNMNSDPTTGDVSPEVVVFYGGNEGVFRAINGNRTASIGSVAAGVTLPVDVLMKSAPAAMARMLARRTLSYVSSSPVSRMTFR